MRDGWPYSRRQYAACLIGVNSTLPQRSRMRLTQWWTPDSVGRERCWRHLLEARRLWLDGRQTKT
jgi:hypothetical protein